MRQPWSPAALLLLLSVAPALAGSPVPITDDAYLNYMPSLLQLQNGSLMIVYERLETSTLFGDLLVSFSDTGESWSPPQVIVGGAANQRHPSVVQRPDGTFLLFYLSNQTGGYRIHRAASADGLSWAEEEVVALGWTTQSVVNPTVLQEPDGSLTMSYDRLSVGGYVAHSVDGVTWDQDRVQVSTGPLNRIMKHSNGTYVLSFQKKSGPLSSNIDIFTRTSIDRVNWSAETRVTATLNSHDSFPLEQADGSFAIFYATASGADPYDLHSQSSADGTTWSAERDWFAYEGWDTEPHPIRLDDGTIGLAWSRGPEQLTAEVVYAHLPTVAGTSPGAGRGSIDLRIVPNPARGPVRLLFTGDPEEGARIEIFDASGRMVRELTYDSVRGGGEWDGRDDSGHLRPRGAYFARLALPGRSAIGTIRLVR
ncbi:MAG: exo-alpha-sialidase [Candidatus Eisenbacteria bacterium]|nr:exo-alpha-sialidase [Candidatus Eisenbacteria bacterium]MCC7143523.1 exo-alpha-sialidase [Candidatus Eisenbacteria bacterium]